MSDPLSFDIAQICLNGHACNASFEEFPEFNETHCTDCGERTITQCESCGAEIRGRYRYNLSASFAVPHFCRQCGEPYPWTEKSLAAATELADMVENLSAEERGQLKTDVGDLVKDSPRSAVAGARFKKLGAKAGKGTLDAFKSIMTDVLSEAVKKTIWP
jgi:hypothetical protein